VIVERERAQRIRTGARQRALRTDGCAGLVHGAQLVVATPSIVLPFFKRTAPLTPVVPI
jgi:hypothetical protein